MKRAPTAVAACACLWCVSAAFSQESPKALMERLNSQVPTQRQLAVDELGGFTSEAHLVPRLAQALEDSDVGVRWRAARALGRFGAGAKPAMKALIRALADQDTLVRAHAARALGEIGSAAPELAKALDHEEEIVRLESVRALAGLGPLAESAVDSLKKAAQDSSELVASEAAAAVRKIETK